MHLTPRELFPLGKAYGKAFCNREKEITQLVGNVQHGKHTLIIAPRRYGKSSLVERVCEKAKLPAIRINFHLCTTEAEVTELVINSVIKLIGEAIGRVDKLMVSIKKYLSTLEPMLSFGNKIVTLKLIPKENVNYAATICEALLLLEKLLKEKKKKAILFFDEFQEINDISSHKGIEGGFRTALQETQHLSVIFSGSIRSLLLSIFEDENRPLYKLCRKIKLDRISATDYEKHIQKIALATWKAPLDPEVFEEIMALSNRHPYYVNYLCDTIWEQCKQLPKLNEVNQAWRLVVTEEWSDALKELSDLPLGQRRLLKYIANQDAKNIQSQEVSKQLSMPPSSIATAANVLREKDYIDQTQDGTFLIINPLLLAVLRGAET